MSIRRRVLIVGWLVVLGLSALLPLSALARGTLTVGWGPLTLDGARLHPLVSFGRTVNLDAGARSMVVVIGGDIRLRGRATDDLVAIAGHVYLTGTSRVDGDVLSVLGGIYRQPGARTLGRIGGAVYRWNGAAHPSHRHLPGLVASSLRLGLAAGLALLLAGTCLTIVFPWQVVLIAATLRDSPLRSVGAALMIVLTFLFLVVPLGLSLAGLPFALLLSAAAALAWLFGLTASAVVVGRLLASRPASLLWTAAAGLVALALAMAIPVIGPLAVTAAGILGAGALVVALIGRARPSTPLP